MNTTKYNNEISKTLLIKNPDFPALSILIDDMRGSMTMELFANKCGISAGTLYKYRRLGRHPENHRPMLVSHLEAMLENKADSSTVTREQLYAANGMASPDEELLKQLKNKVQNISDSLARMKPEKPVIRTKKSKKVVEFQPKDSTTSYDRFLDNLVLYGFGLSEHDMYTLYQKREQLYEDKWVVSLLDQYAEAKSHSELNRKAWEEFILTGSGLDKCDYTAHYAKQTLDNTFGFVSRAEAML